MRCHECNTNIEETQITVVEAKDYFPTGQIPKLSEGFIISKVFICDVYIDKVKKGGKC